MHRLVTTGETLSYAIAKWCFFYMSLTYFPLKKNKNGRIVLRRSLANTFHKSASYRHDIGFHVFILTLWLFYVLAYEIDCLIESMPNTYIRTSSAWLK